MEINGLKIEPNANLSYANLKDADLSCANLSYANLSYANLIGVNLIGANLRGTNFRGADLRSSDLRGTDLRSSDLRDTDLRSSDLREAKLRNADVRGANLRGANLRDAMLYVGNQRVMAVGHGLPVAVEILNRLEKENRDLKDEVKVSAQTLNDKKQEIQILRCELQEVRDQRDKFKVELSGLRHKSSGQGSGGMTSEEIERRILALENFAFNIGQMLHLTLSPEMQEEMQRIRREWSEEKRAKKTISRSRSGP